MIEVREIKSYDEWLALVDAAQKDGHYPLGATHYVTKGEEVVGSFNVGPFIRWWLRKDQGFRETVVIGRKLQQLIKQQGGGQVAMMVAENSPYLEHMERLGFRPDSERYALYFQVEDFENVWSKPPKAA